MSYHNVLSNKAVAISVSESPDMPALGMSSEHLRDAAAEIARHLLALGVQLVYGGDLRTGGFSALLFELIVRHRRDAGTEDERPAIVNFLAWPSHIQMAVADVERAVGDLQGLAELVCLGLYGGRLGLDDRRHQGTEQPTEEEWQIGLTAMRQVISGESQARIVLGGRVESYKGVMPGIAEETLMSLKAGQPLFLLGGFGGCARDIAEALSLVDPWTVRKTGWNGRDKFDSFSVGHLKNGLTPEENAILAKTPHIDQAIALVIRGLVRLATRNPDTPEGT